MKRFIPILMLLAVAIPAWPSPASQSIKPGEYLAGQINPYLVAGPGQHPRHLTATGTSQWTARSRSTAGI